MKSYVCAFLSLMFLFVRAHSPILACVLIICSYCALFRASRRLYDKDAIAAAQEQEGRNPLTLAELFRLTLAFVDEEVSALSGVQIFLFCVAYHLSLELAFFTDRNTLPHHSFSLTFFFECSV
jgi:hypothetical protein